MRRRTGADPLPPIDHLVTDSQVQNPLILKGGGTSLLQKWRGWKPEDGAYALEDAG